jgi:hypothetical protein
VAAGAEVRAVGPDPVDRDFHDFDVDLRTGGGVEAEVVDSPPLISITEFIGYKI